MNHIVTKWHEENPNDWVAVLPGGLTNDLKDSEHHILIDRDEKLMELRKRIGKKDVVYATAWMLGIDKEYPMWSLKKDRK